MVVLTLESVDKIVECGYSNEALEKDFHVVLRACFPNLCKNEIYLEFFFIFSVVDLDI